MGQTLAITPAAGIITHWLGNPSKVQCLKDVNRLWQIHRRLGCFSFYKKCKIFDATTLDLLKYK